MALVSPGLQLTVTDESQYVPGAVGTVPLVVLATAQDKTINGAAATGTSVANAGKLQVFTSQRELANAMGYPVFRQSSAGTPLHGDELNEYGLQAAYSALGVGNQAYVVRADIDLDQLVGTGVRPRGEMDNGSIWLDLVDTRWGVNEWSAEAQAFTSKTPIVITSVNDLDPTTLSGGSALQTSAPAQNIGTPGSYAIVSATAYNRLWLKTISNTWVAVGTDEWMSSIGTLSSTDTTPTIADNSDFDINGTTITLGTSVSVADVSAAINNAAIDGVTAAVIGGILFIAVDSTSASDGSNADGAIELVDGTGSPLSALGIDEGTYYGPAVSSTPYTQVPDWRTNDSTPRPTGSVWVKTSAIGAGVNLAVKSYNTDSSSWTNLTVPVYSTEADAIYGLDPAAGGSNIAVGTIFAKHSSLNDDNGTDLRLVVKTATGATSVTGADTSPTFTIGDEFELAYTIPGQSASSGLVTITLTGTTAESFVSDILGSFIADQYITAKVEATGAITITHTAGGNITLRNVTNTPLGDAGFTDSVAGIRSIFTVDGNAALLASNFDNLSNYSIGLTEPYVAPADGTYWYSGTSNVDVDIMINDNGWKGYRNVSRDARGYNLQNTDPSGVILSASKPTSQSDNTALVAGDLWVDTADLENYPKIYRYTGSTWTAIDNTDRVSQNGIVFADARWDTDGTTDIISDSLPSVTDLTTSNYLDLDAPDYRLYPRGTLLFNTRRSGFNVKKYVENYFNDNSFPNETLPEVTDAWVNASGLQDNGAPYMGRKAQRSIVVEALRAAIDGSTEVREEQFKFNLIAAPGYPELIANMVTLNNDRANTAFVIGDTPMDLAPNGVAIANWSNNTNGDGLTTADPYLGVYYPSGVTNDVDGQTIAVPASHVMLRTYIRNDNVSYPWFAPAGVRRGLVDNANDIGYVNRTTGGFVKTGVTQGLRDTLYNNKINPLTVIPGIGLVSWGQKTRNGSASAMDRVNVARLVNYIREILSTVGNGFLFEPNDKITRDQIKAIIDGAMNDLVSKRGIYDYLVVCDESNNTPTRIARNELYVDIAIEPMKAVEFIYIPIRLYNPGAIASLGQ